MTLRPGKQPAARTLWKKNPTHNETFPTLLDVIYELSWLPAASVIPHNSSSQFCELTSFENGNLLTDYKNITVGEGGEKL